MCLYPLNVGPRICLLERSTLLIESAVERAAYVTVTELERGMHIHVRFSASLGASLHRGTCTCVHIVLYEYLFDPTKATLLWMTCVFSCEFLANGIQFSLNTGE